MSGLFAGWSRETLNVVTDSVGIAAVLGGLFLLLLLDAKGAAGRLVARRWKAAALVVVGFSVLVIGGRFEVLPNAPAANSSTTVVDDSGVAAGPSSTVLEDLDTTSTTVADDPQSPSTTGVMIGPPVPTTAAGGVPDEGPDEPDAVPPTDDREPDAPRGPPADGEYVVQTGDNFWSIAAQSLEDSSGERPSDAEIVTYWQSLIDANAEQLVESGNPDLILPGQVLELPATTTSLPATT